MIALGVVVVNEVGNTPGKIARQIKIYMACPGFRNAVKLDYVTFPEYVLEEIKGAN